MPLISVKTSVRPEPQQVDSLLRELSSRVADHLGKPESYVMTAFEGEVPMTFAGSAEPGVCYLELKSVGQISPATSRAISEDLCALIETRLGVPAARTYIEFAPAQGHLWGWNGRTFG